MASTKNETKTQRIKEQEISDSPEHVEYLPKIKPSYTKDDRKRALEIQYDIFMAKKNKEAKKVCMILTMQESNLRSNR